MDGWDIIYGCVAIVVGLFLLVYGVDTEDLLGAIFGVVVLGGGIGYVLLGLREGSQKEIS